MNSKVTITAALLVGIILGVGLLAAFNSATTSHEAQTSSEATHDGHAASDSVHDEEAHDAAPSGLAAYDEDGDGIVYQDGMHPQIVQDEPGTCPICGMALTPVRVDGQAEEGTVRISPATLQNTGVRTTEVAVESLARQVRTTGRFEANEQRMHAVAPKIGGWVETLHVDYEGARVQTGDPLFEIYSPELVATQEEYLTALRNARRLGQDDSDARRLVEATRRRLAYWDVTDKQINRLEETGTPQRTITFYAPAAGTVTRKNVTEGEKITAGQTLMHVTNLNALWLMVDIYEQDLSWVNVGSSARVELPYAPGQVVTGTVDYIYDEVDSETRTARARITVPNPSRSLKPGMYATVTLEGRGADPTPVVPDVAIVSSGERDVVIQALGEGRFRPVPVQTGLESGGRVQILSGLQGGERVVTSAQFLIDSEARLQGALSAMTDTSAHGTASPPPNPHAGHAH
jgi:RND family efflux transporter MFP subunit